MSITFGSLFAGIGGFDLGFERAGMKCRWQVEIDPFCRKVLAKHWPNVKRYEDVKDVGSNLEHVDVICGGFPCQDISEGGKRVGIEGERSGLWSEYARTIGEIRPRFVVVENVAALLGRGFGRVLGDLAKIGYDAEWECLPACAFGAPHMRDRVFIVAYPNQDRDCRIFGTDRQVEADGCWSFAKDEQEWDRGFSKLESMDIAERSPSYSEALRILDGIPAWLDRTGSLGNAVIPQIAEWIGRRIVKVLTEEMVTT